MNLKTGVLSACAVKVIAKASTIDRLCLAGSNIPSTYIPLLASASQLRNIIEISHYSAMKIKMGMGFSRDEFERAKLMLFPGFTKAYRSKEEAEKHFAEA